MSISSLAFEITYFFSCIMHCQSSQLLAICIFVYDQGPMNCRTAEALLFENLMPVPKGSFLFENII